MPAPYAEECAELCEHKGFTTGCPACRLEDHLKDLTEAKSERLSAIEACRGPQEQLARATCDQEREDAQESLKEAQALCPACDKRIEAIEGALVVSRNTIKAICDANEPGTLAKAFAECVEEEMFGLTNIWHTATKQGEFLQLHPADSDYKVAIEVLDRSQIPATADCLISEGTGLSTFMYAGRSLREQRTPMQTVGEIAGPAFMSHGRALEMFGGPEDPGDDKPAATQKPGDDLFGPLLTELQKPSVASEPRTEAQFREKYPQLYGPTKSIVPAEKDPWTAVLGFNKFARWTPMLCSQYVALVRAKKENTIVYGYEGWPEVGSLTFEGFTNWVLNCRAVDPLFGRTTIKRWEDNMKERNATILGKLRASKVFEACTDAQLGIRPATQYYTGKQSLMEEDL